jgi:hypothetical protein
MIHRLILVCALFVFPMTASAHGTGLHVLGTVTAIDSAHIEVKTPKGALVSINLNKDTRFMEKGHPKSTELPVVGDRVVIEAAKDNKTLTAVEVHFSAGKRVTPPTAAPAAEPGQ